MPQRDLRLRLDRLIAEEHRMVAPQRLTDLVIDGVGGNIVEVDTLDHRSDRRCHRRDVDMPIFHHSPRDEFGGTLRADPPILRRFAVTVSGSDRRWNHNLGEHFGRESLQTGEWLQATIHQHRFDGRCSDTVTRGLSIVQLEYWRLPRPVIGFRKWVMANQDAAKCRLMETPSPISNRIKSSPTTKGPL